MQINICYCLKYCLYNTNLPSWLCNKPKLFLGHCIEKLSLAKDIPEKNIKHMDNDSLLKSKIRIFITINHMLIQLIGKVYNLHIVSAPIERRLTIYVKHIVAIFQIIKDNWESLPEAYKIFPYFSLDISIIFSNRAHSTQQRKYSSR